MMFSEALHSPAAVLQRAENARQTERSEAAEKAVAVAMDAALTAQQAQLTEIQVAFEKLSMVATDAARAAEAPSAELTGTRGTAARDAVCGCCR